MKVRDEIEKFSDPEERADLLAVFSFYHMNSEWNILATCEFIGTFPNAKRKWHLSPIGKAVAFQHRSAEKVRILREALEGLFARGLEHRLSNFPEVAAARAALEATKEGA